jgi:hypothetical protein
MEYDSDPFHYHFFQAHRHFIRDWPNKLWDKKR